jgi:prevent-host-death family protein
MATPTRTIQSSEAKVHFARLLDDVYSHGTRYVVQRFGMPRAVLISLADYERLVAAERENRAVAREHRPPYQLGVERTPEEIAALLGLEGEATDDH